MDFVGNGATFSPCGKYRYRLWRRWSDQPLLNWLMLNPSTADANSNDPTVERCQRRAEAAGYGGILVTNLFALRSTDPRVLKRAIDPVGPDDDDAIVQSALASERTICGWGNDGLLRGRGPAVYDLLRIAGVAAYALRLTSKGQPWHPLYVGYDVEPVLWEELHERRIAPLAS